MASLQSSVRLPDLTPDCLEMICSYLDLPSCNNMLRLCRDINYLLTQSGGFWKHLSHLEGFQDYQVLRSAEEADHQEMKSYLGEELHSEEARERCKGQPYWRKVYLRGMEMRRNLVSGRYQHWRLFMTGGEYLPVKQMTPATTNRELRTQHRKSRFYDQRRRVRVDRFWSEKYLVVIQHGGGGWEGGGVNQDAAQPPSPRLFHDVFVWRWTGGKQPEFLFSRDLAPLYPNPLFPTAFFLWRDCLVFMPEAGYIIGTKLTRTVIRVHSVAQTGFPLVGSWDLPEDGEVKRLIKYQEGGDSPHLHLLDKDKALLLCRTTQETTASQGIVGQLHLFIFSLPSCELLHEFPLPQLPSPTSCRPLHLDELNQQCFVEKGGRVFMFTFHHPDFLSHLFQHGEGGGEEFFSRLLHLDFKDFLAACRNGNTGVGPVCRVGEKLESNRDYLESMVLSEADDGSSLLYSVSRSGKIIRQKVEVDDEATLRFSQLPSVWSPPGRMKEDNMTGLQDVVEADGPYLVVCRKVFVVLRNYLSGRKIHAYSIHNSRTDNSPSSRNRVQEEQRPLYELDVDCDLVERTGIGKQPGLLWMDLDNNFLALADLHIIILFKSWTGQLLRTISLPGHYHYRCDPMEQLDHFVWRGHSDFAFSEDGIILIHGPRYFPAAADIILFW